MEFFYYCFVVGDQLWVGVEGYQYVFDVLWIVGGGCQFVGDYVVVGYEFGGQFLFVYLLYQWIGFWMQVVEVDDFGIGGVDFGDQCVEVFFVVSQVFVENFFYVEFVQLCFGGVCQVLVVGVFVMDYCDFFGFEYVDDIVVGDYVLLVVVVVYVEYFGEFVFGDLWVGGIGGDGDDFGFVVDFGCGDG